MGAYSPSTLLDENLEKKIKTKIIEPTLKAMKEQGNPYKGFLYAGLMIKDGEPFLIEYNIRMGDPECQVLMKRLKSDLVDILNLADQNQLNNLEIQWERDPCITIVLCSNGYPNNYIKNSEIQNLSSIILDKNSEIFHAGTYEENNIVYSNGGRVLNITCLGENLKKAREKSLNYIGKIKWKDGFFRKDIGWKAIDKNEDN